MAGWLSYYALSSVLLNESTVQFLEVNQLDYYLPDKVSAD